VDAFGVVIRTLRVGACPCPISSRKQNRHRQLLGVLSKCRRNTRRAREEEGRGRGAPQGDTHLKCHLDCVANKSILLPRETSAYLIVMTDECWTRHQGSPRLIRQNQKFFAPEAARLWLTSKNLERIIPLRPEASRTSPILSVSVRYVRLSLLLHRLLLNPLSTCTAGPTVLCESTPTHHLYTFSCQSITGTWLFPNFLEPIRLDRANVEHLLSPLESSDTVQLFLCKTNRQIIVS